MKFKTIYLILINIAVFLVGVAGVVYKHNTRPSEIVVTEPSTPSEPMKSPLSNQPELPPIQNKITKAYPSYLNYEQTVVQLKQWNQEAPEMTEVGTYGKSSSGKDIYYIRIYNKRYSKTSEKPCVLITACIHGNEPLSSSTTMWYIGTLLDKYGKDEAITQLIDNRDIYFVPVVSPDSYPNSRHVDGVDPNRNFPGPNNPNRQSVPPVKAIQDFFMKIKPKAVISGHTWGRVYLIPYGDRMQNCPDHESYVKVIGKMSELSGYRWIRACDMYKSDGSLAVPPVRDVCSCLRTEDGWGAIPIHGSEIDWYYRNGAFAIVCEYGTHQRIPSDSDIQTEFNKTFSAFLHYLREAPLVQVHPNLTSLDNVGKLAGSEINQPSR
jgi:hypothetical protein